MDTFLRVLTERHFFMFLHTKCVTREVGLSCFCEIFSACVAYVLLYSFRRGKERTRATREEGRVLVLHITPQHVLAIAKGGSHVLQQ